MEMMKEIRLGVLCAVILFLLNGIKPLSAQQSVFNVYSKSEDTIKRDLTYRDMQLIRMQGTDTKFSLPSYTSRSKWNKRRQYLQDHILISAGLFPKPFQTSLNPHIFDKIEHEKYTVEKVYLESYPDFYLAGNLYRPKGEGPFPGVLSSHGHWDDGRLHSDKRGSVPGRNINLARQGYVVFSYDMVGYGDTRQVDHDFAAGDSLAQLWGINLLGLQLWDSMRALEFLRSLPDVDSSRIGITGASGGGTQTFLLDAVTDRETIDVSAPVNMISATMQGGCVCENAPGLRLNTFNVEIAGVFAPQPQLMISNTHDWTKNTPWSEYPMLRSIYKLYNASNRLDYRYFDYPHNYNKSSREAVYRWFNKWMPGKKKNSMLREEPFTIEPDSNLLVFLKKRLSDDGNQTFKEMDPSRYHHLPVGTLQMGEPALKRYLKKVAKQQLEKYWPTNQSEWEQFDAIYGKAYRHIIAGSIPKKVNKKIIDEGPSKNFHWEKILLGRPNKHDWIPSFLFLSQDKKKYGSAGVTLLISPEGKSAFFNQSGTKPNKLVQSLLDRGQSVMAIDVFKTGEHVLPEGIKTERDEDAPHFTTFNKTDTQQRIQDILTAGKFLKERYPQKELSLVGLNDAGIWSILAAPLAPMFKHIISDGIKLNLKKSEQWLSFYIPGLLKYGDLKTALALTAKQNTKTTFYNVNRNLDVEQFKTVYEILNQPNSLSITLESLYTEDIVHILTD